MTKFKVMTWNLENLFPVGHKSGPKTQQEFDGKLDALAHAIQHIDADVIAVQEIGNATTFTDLIARIPTAYQHNILSTYPDPRGIRVGFISKLPFVGTQHISNFHQNGLVTIQGVDGSGNPTSVTKCGRGILRVCVNPKPNFSVHLITAHLKSKLLTFPKTGGGASFSTKDEDLRAKVAGVALIKRTGEAVSLRVIANEILKTNTNDGVIVLGDLNDEIHAATTQILHGPTGSEIGTRGFNIPDQYDYVRLFNVSLAIKDSEQRYSRIHKSTKEMLDQEKRTHSLELERLKAELNRERTISGQREDEILQEMIEMEDRLKAKLSLQKEQEDEIARLREEIEGLEITRNKRGKQEKRLGEGIKRRFN